MHFGRIDLPEDVLEAHRAGNLVIFAGAGISRPRPSRLPDFRELVREIEDASGFTRGHHESFDAFLGRLERDGFPVHRKVEGRVARTDSEPNRLHRAIIRLFRDPDSVRIVTTNFDRHLTSAARKRWSGVREFVAPALPSGGDFRGIVYLHGAAGTDPKSLILTDADFGVAYLTKGFVRRFLVELFQENCVLFVGFSHGDTVLSYLARGLPPGTRRYAITSAKDTARWEGLGIIPVVHPKGTRREVTIAECLEAWGRDISMGVSDHEREVRQLVHRGPDGMDSNSRDYLLSRIRDPDTTPFFCREASDPGWLDWLSNVPEFEALFLRHGPDDEVIRQLAFWFAERFSVDHPQEALATVARRGDQMSPLLWVAVASHLWDQRPAPDVLRSWLSLLLPTAPDRTHDLVEYLLVNARAGEDDDVALLLFDFLTEPRPRSRILPDVSAEGHRARVDIEATSRGNPYWLDQSLETVFKPRIDSFARDLLAIATKHLEQVRQLQGPKGDMDLLSLRRSAIEPHEQDEASPKDWLDVLVNAARESIEWAIAHDHDLARTYVALWERARAPLLQRLAVHGVRLADWLAPDQKIGWLLKLGWLYRTPLHHEVYRLLAEAYPASGPDARAQVLTAIDQGPDGEPYVSRPDLRDRERFELLDWLATHTPDDENVRQARDAILERHPGWQPREHPDLLMWMDEGDWLEPAGRSVQDMVAQDPEDPAVLSRLLGAGTVGEGTDSFFGPRRDLLEVVAAACREQPRWGLRLARELARASRWETDLWGAVIQGWNDGPLGSSDWRRILELLQSHPAKAVHASPIARLLEQGVRVRPPRIPPELLHLSDAIALELWNALAGDVESASPTPDWLSEAINEPAGQLVMYFLHGLALREPSAGLPADLRQVFQDAVEGGTLRDALGACVLASQLHFLYGRDRDWTTAVLIPAMRWNQDPARAQRMWHGFLTWGKLNPGLVEELLSAYESVLGHVEELGRLADRFTEHLAFVAFLAAQDPLAQGWLNAFIRQASEEYIADWTRHMTFRLRAMPAADRRGAWRRWIARYWKQRNEGLPRALCEREARELVAWALEMDEDFDEAVGLVCAGPRAGAPDAIFYPRFREQGHADRHPAAAVRLLAHVLAGERRPFWECDEASEIAIAAARSGRADPGHLREIIDQLLRLRCVGGDDLRRAIDGK